MSTVEDITNIILAVAASYRDDFRASEYAFNDDPDIYKDVFDDFVDTLVREIDNQSKIKNAIKEKRIQLVDLASKQKNLQSGITSLQNQCSHIKKVKKGNSTACEICGKVL